MELVLQPSTGLKEILVFLLWEGCAQGCPASVDDTGPTDRALLLTATAFTLSMNKECLLFCVSAPDT